VIIQFYLRKLRL